MNFSGAQRVVDHTVDMRADTPVGKDPDRYSATLRLYHRILWSKPLPNGEPLLSPGTTDFDLKYAAKGAEWALAPDGMNNSYRHWKRLRTLTDAVPKTKDPMNDCLSNTIGNSIIFPSHRINGGSTINGARGLHHLIRDRLDLSLECIRRQYRGEANPLAETLANYWSFFEKFGSFLEYARFFLLDDLIDEHGKIRFFLPFSGFSEPAVPKTVEEYREYYHGILSAISSRNSRIAS